MSAYVLFVFTAPGDNASYMREVAEKLKLIAGANFKRGESAAGITAIAFKTDAEPVDVKRAFTPLWRPEQRLWVLPLDAEPGPLLIDGKLMDWALGR